MRLILLCFTLVAFCAAVHGKVETVKDCGLRKHIISGGPMMSGGIGGHYKYILGGTPVRLGGHPWMASLQLLNKDDGLVHKCGGTIINRYWVLTAAHCIDRSIQASDYYIYVGANKLSSWKSGEGAVYKVKKIIIHEHFDRQTYDNDIALVRTFKPININSAIGLVNGICLPPKDEEPTGKAIVAGWGHTQYRGKKSDVLQEVEVPMVPRGECSKFYPRIIPESVICYGGEIGKDSCQGDSGGPLVQRKSDGRYTIIGIVSAGVRCGRKTPGKYTKVSAFIDWMDAKMTE